MLPHDTTSGGKKERSARAHERAFGPRAARSALRHGMSLIYPRFVRARCFLVSLLVACGGGGSTVRPDCPVGQTSLDGTCVSQQIADYVGCIRATGATVASDNSRSLSAAAGAAGASASSQADVKDKLERRYATQSDANSLEIIRHCYSRTGAPLTSEAEKVAGRWRHVVNGAVYGWIELKVDPGSRDHGHTKGEHGDAGSWSIEGRTVKLHWPRKDAPDGEWIDTVKLSDDGTSWSGSNQGGAKIEGQRLPAP